MNLKNHFEQASFYIFCKNEVGTPDQKKFRVKVDLKIELDSVSLKRNIIFL